MPHPDHSRHRLSAFTLIELLTVIAIIGILAAIIIPTVGKVRQSAKNAQCVAQLRDWGRVINLYANDNKGNYYTLNWASVAPTDAPQGHNYQPYYNKSNQEGFRMRYCPADPQTPTLLENPSGENPRYALIQGSVNGAIISEDKTKPAMLPLSRAISPSQYMLMVDTVEMAGTTFRLNATDPTGMQNALEPLVGPAQAQRHGTKFNALFADGSVKRVGWNRADLLDKTNVFAMKSIWLKLY